VRTEVDSFLDVSRANFTRLTGVRHRASNGIAFDATVLMGQLQFLALAYAFLMLSLELLEFQQLRQSRKVLDWVVHSPHAVWYPYWLWGL
jgi:hypothetical protein